MAQYMYDKDGNRTVILSEDEEQKKQEEKTRLECVGIGAIFTLLIINIKIGDFIIYKSFNGLLLCGIIFVVWFLCCTLLFSLYKITNRTCLLIFAFLVGFCLAVNYG